MDKWLDTLPGLDLRTMSPLTLAYVGDAVFELYIRMQLACHGGKINQLHQSAVGLVNAEAQKDILRQWEPQLTEEEMGWVRRGRNAKSSVPRSADVVTYRLSTGLETLVGYLFLSGQEKRLLELLKTVSIVSEDEQE